MEANVDEIAQSYEIIEKTELETAQIDDESNNNKFITEPAIQESTSQEATPLKGSNDDNNNQSGNHKYTRDELIKLKQAMVNPAPQLQDSVKGFIYKEAIGLDRVLDRSKPMTRSDAVDKMMPSYANMPANARGSYQKQRSGDYQSGRRSAQGNRSQTSSLIKLSLQSNEDVKLNEAKSAWKPQMLVSDQEIPEDEKKTSELVKQFRSILNKITPENFPTLIQQLKSLNIDSVDVLDSCISLVFEKAIMEPSYGASYASLCKEVSDVFVVPLDDKNTEQKAVFKKRLITQCQLEFEKHRNNEIVRNNGERLKEIEDEEDATKKEELKTNFELESFKIRRRAVGTVHFIGELYKIEMLTSRIMQSCVSHLLDPAMCSEETLECLCKLLTTIGKRLEKLDVKKVDLSDCFATLANLADKQSAIGISSRIRFMIQDLIELRLNHWTPRKLQEEIKPEKLDQIKAKVIREEIINKMENKEMLRSEQNDRGQNRSDRSGFYQGGGSTNNKRGNIVSEDGWSTQYSKSRPLKFDINKLQLKPQNEEIVLGNVPSFQNFGNRFSGLKEEEPVGDQSNRSYNGRLSGGQSMNQNRGSFGNQNRGNRNNNRSAGSRSLQPPLPSNQNQNQKQQFGPGRKISQQNTPIQRSNDFPAKSNSMNRKISAPARSMQNFEPSNRPQEVNLITNVDQVSDALKKMLKAYQSEEMTLNEVVEKLCGFEVTEAPLVVIYNWVFDQHDKERFQMTEIICECVSRNIIMTKDLLVALQEIFEVAQDLACDLPKIYNYLGQLLALPLLRRIIQVKDLLEMSKLEIEVKNGATVLKNVFSVFEQKYQKESLIQLYKEAGIDFQLFLDEETKLADFLKENVRNKTKKNFQRHNQLIFFYFQNFDYLTTRNKTPEPLVELDESIRKKIQEMVKSPDIDADILWIEVRFYSNFRNSNNSLNSFYFQTHVKSPTDKSFVRAMTETILEHCLVKTIDGSYELIRQKLENCAPYLNQFLDQEVNREVQCLHVITRMIVEREHPSGCLHEILSCLYDNFALSKTGFFKWRDDEDPLEQEGKGEINFNSNLP